MSDFIVSARKYRPSNFSSVVGQDSITKTLENAINNEQLAHAYLFCGPRGVGKTSCARIFAKAINQENDEDERDFSFNIFELDAASNNKVDDIRQLIDQVRIHPQVGKYKVYIIDEVHMLTKGAFNAFLKTLEEPPKHAIFILATTEKHKIIPTILSRCQIYDFNRITTDDIAKHLAFVAEKEEVVAEEEALYLIAQKADGALRDALSIFDQIVSFNGKQITYEKVLENLNILDHDHFFGIMEKVQKNDRAAIFLSIEDILANGFELSHFSSGLAQHIRDLMVCKDQSTVKLIEVSQSLKNKYIERSTSIEEKFLLNALHLLNESEVQMKTSVNQRLLVELTLLKIANLFGKPVEKKSPELIEVRSPLLIRDDKVDLEKQEVPEKKLPEPSEEKIISRIEIQNEEIKSEQQIVEATSNDDSSVIKDAFAEYKTSVKEIDHPNRGTQENPEDLTEKIDTSNNEPLVVTRPKIMRSISSISLDPSLKVNKEKQDGPDLEIPEKIINKKLVTQDGLEASWKRFAEKIKAKGKYNLAAGLMSKQPTLENNEIHFVLDNKVLEAALSNERSDLLFHLRKELVNDALVFDHSIDSIPLPTPESGPAEKFREMSEKNPILKELKDQMDLGLE